LEKPIIDYVSEMAYRFPLKEALICEDSRWNFHEFHRQVNKVASLLVHLKSEKGGRVGVILNRSNEHVAINFGIMQTGCCFVPMGPLYPIERIFQIIIECNIETVFINAATLKKICSLSDVPPSLKNLIIVDKMPEGFVDTRFQIISFEGVPSVPEKDCTRRVIDKDLAYIMYTSGSSGNPKGVMISHRNILTFLEWCLQKLSFSENDRILNLTPFTFDVSGFDIFNMVRHGACVVIADPYPIVEKIFFIASKEHITFISTVPTNIGLMLRHPELFNKYDLSAIRTFASGAAVCPSIYMKRLHELLPQAKLLNLYGPTEATIYCMYYEIDPEKIDIDRSLSIGKPFENTEAYVLDPEGNHVSPGITGELVLRGSHISAGYVNNKEETEAVFKPFSVMPHLNERVYYTGDFVEMDESGNMYFLGRKDDMIKSRGYRIELNEIEIALSTIPAIYESCVVPIPDMLLENKIYAVVALKQNAMITDNQIKSVCRKRLPPYMTPDEVVFMETLPKTPNGKVDKKKIADTILKKTYVAQQTK